MESLATLLAFVLITGLAIRMHLRATAKAGGGSAMMPNCPRCGTALHVGAMRCRQCGAPQQAYELVSAPVVEGELAAGSGAPKAMVRADVCVGCGTCVDACPEPGAITMHKKLAVVDDALCKGHGECVAACPVGGILVTTGAAVNRVSVPLVNANFESNLPGLYIVGELGGRGLIKNAVNEGRLAVEHIASTLAPATADERDAVDVLIVGSGPAGLSAGVEAIRSGLKYVMVEQGALSESVRKYPRHKLLLAEPIQMPLYGNLWVADTSKESLLRAWESIVASSGLQVRTGERVLKVTPEGTLFDVETSAGRYRTRRVVLAMGRRGSPRKLGVVGEELSKVVYEIVEMEQFAGRRVLVVGGGDSAIESAVGLGNQDGTTVQLSYRGESFPRIKPRNQEKLDRAVAAGRITLLLQTQLREVRAEVAVLEGPAGAMIIPNDDVVIRIGGDAPFAFLEQIGVRIVQKDVPIPRDVEKVS
ncbi:MAG: NAD(P)-binding domain-containing protein [Gemmatimonadetes bacterium]|nr:NAD(P)-binding domain-containing protein [Gemmatimonadota bacterium]